MLCLTEFSLNELIVTNMKCVLMVLLFA